MSVEDVVLFRLTRFFREIANAIGKIGGMGVHQGREVMHSLRHRLDLTDHQFPEVP